MAVIHRIDRVLPRGVQVHLFGVKSAGIRAILSEGALDGRVRSIDSMAWDFAARVRFRTGRTTARRVSMMREWHERQVATASAAAMSAQHSLLAIPFRDPPAPSPVEDDALEEIVELLSAGEVDLPMAAALHRDDVMSGRSPLPVVPRRRPALPIPRIQAELALAA
jgi:hypothetical protein